MSIKFKLLIIACVLICSSVQHRYQPPNQHPVLNPLGHQRQNNPPSFYYQHRKPAIRRPQMNKPFTSFNAAQFAQTTPTTSTHQPQHHKRQSVIDVLSKNSEQYSTLITAAQKAGLVDTLSTG